ncbi:hypothetical protein [Kitasatospora sp. NPDC048538]|uniref:hypothetical protein n=1 Tax=unclassified Kitasatospora TaxID=2633591 RepID=UPI00340EDF8C
MDGDIEAMSTTVREARAKIREDALPRARARREAVVPADQAALLAELIDLVDTAAELADAVHMRMTTPDGRTAYLQAGRRLRDPLEHLRGHRRRLTAQAGSGAGSESGSGSGSGSGAAEASKPS